MFWAYLALCFICPILCPLWIFFMIVHLMDNKKNNI